MHQNVALSCFTAKSVLEDWSQIDRENQRNREAFFMLEFVAQDEDDENYENCQDFFMSQEDYFRSMDEVNDGASDHNPVQGEGQQVGNVLFFCVFDGSNKLSIATVNWGA